MPLFKEEFLTRKAAADYLKVSVSLLEALAHKGDGPIFYKINARTTRYYTTNLEDWLSTRRTHKFSDNQVLLWNTMIKAGTNQ